MEMPIALLLLSIVEIVAWIWPGFAAAVFVIVLAVSAYMVIMAVMAQRSARGR